MSIVHGELESGWKGTGVSLPLVRRGWLAVVPGMCERLKETPGPAVEEAIDGLKAKRVDAGAGLDAAICASFTCTSHAALDSSGEHESSMVPGGLGNGACSAHPPLYARACLWSMHAYAKVAGRRRQS
jgi:hypothetical protein